jgi:hypothetical protein
MPTPDEYLRLRRMVGEEDPESKYSDTDLDAYILEGGTLAGAAALIWGEKSSDYADLVNISESGSSRSNSDLFKHAKEQQTYFESLTNSGTATVAGSTTRRIVRA